MGDYGAGGAGVDSQEVSSKNYIFDTESNITSDKND